MANRPLQYATIFLTCFIDILGFGIVIPVLPLYAEKLAATPIQLGWLIGIFSLAQFFFAPIWGKVSDRVGRKPVLLVGLIGTIAGYVMMGLAGSVGMLMLARLIAGIAGANISAAQAYLADISTAQNRARAMGLLGAAFGLGFVFGPALGGWASVKFGSYAMPMYIAAGLAAVNFCFVLFFLPESLPRKGAGGRREAIFPHLFSHIDRPTFLWCVASYFLVITGFSMMTTLFALVLLHRFDLDALHAGYIFAGIGVIGVIIQGGLIGRLVTRFGERTLALTGAIIMAGGLGGLAFCTTFPVLLATSALVGIGNSLLMPCLSALASRSADPDWQGRALGVMQSGGSFARWVGPMFAGILLAVSLNAEQAQYAVLPMAVSAGVLILAAGALTALAGQGRSKAVAPQ